MKFAEVAKEINKFANKERAKISASFSKTGKGEYAEGVIHLGLDAKKKREIAKKFVRLPLSEIQKLLKLKAHDYRIVALLILVEQFRKGDERIRKIIADFYLKNTRYMNGWYLVDLSAYKILGQYFFNKSRSVLYLLSKSNDLWKRRISIVTTYYFIQNNDYRDTLNISKILFKDKEDLIHKATGWMLREVGKRNQKILVEFLDKYTTVMPRTTLRYAIEKFPEAKRQKYLNKI